MEDWFLAWLNVSDEPFWHYLLDLSAYPFRYGGLVPRMVECKCRAFLTLVVRCECWAFLIRLWDVFPHGQMWVLGVPFWYDYSIGSYMIRYKCWASHYDLGSDKCWKKTYMEARPTTNMKKVWLCRTSCDEKNHEIAPVMIQWWWSSSDDLDRVMIQIQWWWSRSSDDLDQDEDDLKMMRTQWWSRWYREE